MGDGGWPQAEILSLFPPLNHICFRASLDLSALSAPWTLLLRWTLLEKNMDLKISFLPRSQMVFQAEVQLLNSLIAMD